MFELECRLLHAERPAAEPSRGGLLVRLHAGRDARESGVPLNLAIVLDLGGAMEGEPLEAVREGILRLCAGLRRGDRVLLLGAERRPRRILGWREASDGTRIAEVLRRLRVGEGCDLEAALGEADRELASSPEPCFRRIVAVSGSPGTAVARRGFEVVPRPHPVSLLGVGESCDSARLAGRASQSGGCFRYVEEPADAVPALARLGARHAALRWLDARVEVSPLARTACGDTARRLGDLEAGEVVEAWFPLRFDARRQGRFVVAEVSVHAGDRAVGPTVALSATPEVAFVEGASGTSPDRECEAAELADSARTLLTSGHPSGEQLEMAASLLERAGRARAAAEVRARAARGAGEPNPALAAVVCDLVVRTDFTG